MAQSIRKPADGAKGTPCSVRSTHVHRTPFSVAHQVGVCVYEYIPCVGIPAYWSYGGMSTEYGVRSTGVRGA